MISIAYYYIKIDIILTFLTANDIEYDCYRDHRRF